MSFRVTNESKYKYSMVANIVGHMAIRKASSKAIRKNAKSKPTKKMTVTPKIKISAKASRATHMWKTQLLSDPQVRQMLINLAGEHTLHVITEFGGQMSDEEIAKRTKLRTSDVRVVLNKMHSCGLVSYSRSRDKNSGWYSYVWKMNNDKAQEIIDHLKGECQDKAGNGHVGEDGEFYECPSCPEHGSVSFGEASDLYFRCTQCGGSLAYVDEEKK